MHSPLAVAALVAAAVAVGCSTSYERDPGPRDGATDVSAKADGPGSCSGGAAKAVGQPCACPGECASGFCTEGVCCDASCKDACRSCKVANRVGTCTAVPAGVTPVDPAQCPRQDIATCGRDGTCDGAGRCRNHPEGVVCGPGRCEAGAVVEGKTCRDGLCQGTGARVVCAPYSCDAATGSCSDACIMSMPGTSCGPKDLGMVCSKGADCKSGFCADGLCCSTACDAGCVQCNLPGKLGACTPTPKDGADPHGLCIDTGVAGCGTSGRCTGMGTCAKYPAGTRCQAASCTGATLMPARSCDGNGACTAGALIDCSPYLCSDATCLTLCTDDNQCVPGRACNNGVCGDGLLALGRACQSNDQCTSRHCADGVCCNEVCGGKCRFCASAAAAGRCVNVPAGASDPRAARGEKDPDKICRDEGSMTCGTNGTCDGAGGCALFALGTLCKNESCDGATNFGSPAWTCNGSGNCMASPQQTCAPYTCNGNACGTACSDNTQCVTPNVCTSGSCGAKPNGAPCGAAADCAGGVCAQGICCSTPCDGVCFSCAMPGKQGVCAAVTAGGPDPTGTCTDQGVETCGNDGTCNGSGACRKYPAGAVCTQPSCFDAMAASAGTCNGLGSCTGGQMRLCEPYVCNDAGTGCHEACTTAAQCAAGTPCVGGSCGKKPLGGTCTASADCTSGFCADGVCCNSACTGLCQTCALPAALGTCSPVPAGVADGTGCSATAASTCQTNGLCNGAGGCQFWPSNTVCRPSSCPAGTNMATRAATCDGAGGVCPAGAIASCGAFQCDGARNTCKSSCTVATRAQDWFGDAACVSSGSSFICGAPKANGAACVSGAECTSGQCVDGTCCASASCGTCQRCTTGSCSPVAAGTADSRCATTGADVCTTNGLCGTGGVCAPTTAGTGCGTACTADGKQQNLTCSGAGACSASGAPVSCGSFRCDGNACLKRCNSTADCAPGLTCRGGSGMCK